MEVRTDNQEYFWMGEGEGGEGEGGEGEGGEGEGEGEGDIFCTIAFPILFFQVPCNTPQ